MTPRIRPSLLPWLAILALQAPFQNAYAVSAPDGTGPSQRAVAVLDPVDLTTRKSDSTWGDFLRRRFAATSAWKVIGRDSMRAKEKEFSFTAYRGCHEFQCAFDAGNIFAAEYVFYSSLTRLDGAFAYTMNLLHVPSSRTVWSGVGQAGPGQIGDSRVSLQEGWTRRIDRLSSGKDRLSPGKTSPKGKGGLGLVTALDLGAGGRWAPAQAIAERVATHLNAARGFDIMGVREQEELVGALGIDRSAFIPTDSAVFDLGRRMGVTHLVTLRLVEDRRHALRLELGYYDIAKRRKVKAERSDYTRNHVDILRFETDFFSSLFPIDKDGEDGLEEPGNSRSSWFAAAAGVAAGAVGVAGGYMAYRFDQASQEKYGKIEDARSRQSALALRGEAAGLERRARIWGGVGIAGAMAGGALLVFSF